MESSAGGAGTANDAEVAVESPAPLTPEGAEEARLVQGRVDGKANRLADAEKAVERAEASLAKLEGHVEGAKAAIEQAKADRDAIAAEEV